MTEVLIYIALGIVLIIQLWALFRKKTLSRKQLTVKVILNTLLWLVLLLFVIQPKWKSSENHKSVLVYSAQSKREKINKIQDNLNIKKAVSYEDFKQKWADFTDREVHFLGQDAELELLSHLAGKSVHWIPEVNGLQKISWEGILRRGELQTVSGKVNVENSSVIKIQYADQILDSLKLEKGFNAFDLRFPVSIEGRNEVSLVLDNKEIQKIHFFATPSPELSILMLLDNPDFESKTLSEWLGRQGYKAQILTEVAKSTLHQSEVNSTQRNFKPDLIISSPSKSGDIRVKKAVNERKSVLFVGLTDAVSESQLINRNLGTQFQLKRISAEETVLVGKDLTALPYQFNSKSIQRTLKTLPIAYQKKTGRVAVSLLNETFPLKLSGDSLQYNQIWAETLSPFLPKDSGAIYIQAPVYVDVTTEIVTNPTTKDFLHPGSDTLSLTASAVNAENKSGNYVFRNGGWQSINDSLQVFVEEPNSGAYLEHWIKANGIQASTSGVEFRSIPDWLWFVFILLCLTALWIEPKVKY
jgi:hypothetical protein